MVRKHYNACEVYTIGELYSHQWSWKSVIAAWQPFKLTEVSNSGRNRRQLKKKRSSDVREIKGTITHQPESLQPHSLLCWRSGWSSSLLFLCHHDLHIANQPNKYATVITSQLSTTNHNNTNWPKLHNTRQLSNTTLLLSGSSFNSTESI